VDAVDDKALIRRDDAITLPREAVRGCPSEPLVQVR